MTEYAPLRARFFDFVRHYGRRRPNHVALADLASGRALSYRTLDERIDRVASGLVAHYGVEPGDRVAVLAHNAADIVEIQFACWRVGAVFLPLNWRLARRELEFIVSDAAPKVLILDQELAELGAGLEGGLPVLETRCGAPSPYESLIDAGDRPAPDRAPLLSDVGSVMYTAGTTGRPKGALITHAMTFYNAVNLAIAARISRDTVHLVALPLFHTGGLNCYLNVVLHHGGTNLIMRKFDAADALELLTAPDRGVTHFFGVPAHYQFVAEQPGFPSAELRLVNAGVGGAPCPRAMLEEWGRKGVPMQQGYGLTETSPTALVLDTDRALDKLGSAGLPALHTEVELRSESGQPVPTGDVGEIWVRGDNVSPGYWNRPDANRESFIDGWLKTGDAARQDADGYFYIVDRWKDMFISGGENVYPAEVENAIYELPGVFEVAVVGVPDEKWGEVGKAHVVLRPQSSLDEAAITEHCRTALARYKVPKSVEFETELPRNAAGKILKRELKDRGPRRPPPSA